METSVDKFYLVFKKCLLMFGGSRSRPSETARPSQAMPPFSPLSTIGSHSNFIHETKTRAKGQFHAKRTRFDVTVSKLIFLDQNMLVRPHEVH